MILSVMLGPQDTLPVQRSDDLNEPKKNKGYRRPLEVNLYPDEYLRFQAYCKKRRVALATMARTILLAYLTKMEGRGEEDGSGLGARGSEDRKR